MTSIVNAKEFLEAITKATKVNKGRQTLPILEEVKIDFINGKCIITTTNLEQWGIFSISANGDNFTIVPQNTSSIVKACKYFKGDLTFEYNEEKNIVKLSSNNKSCKIACCDSTDYPEIPEVTATNTYHYNANTLFDRYEKIKYAISQDDLRPINTGVYFNKNQMATIDGYRLAINSNDELNIESEFVVPQGAMNLLNIFEKTDIEIDVCKKYVAFKDQNTTIISRLLEGDFFDYNGAIPKNNSDEYIVEVKQYINELKYLKDFTSSRDRNPIKFDNGNLCLYNSNGIFTAKVDIKGKANAVYGFNINYMMDGLSQFKDNKNVVIKSGTSVDPIILTDNKDNLALVLPVKLKYSDEVEIA